MALTRRRKLNEANLAELPTGSGVYVLYGAQGSPAYVGRARSLRASISGELASGRIPAETFAYETTESAAEATKLADDLVRRFLPRFNVHSAA